MRIFAVILGIFTAMSSTFAMQRIELTSLAQVGVEPAYYVVKQDIAGGEATFAAGSVLAFEGGMLKGCTVSGDFTVSAPEYRIFDNNTTVKGLRNAAVPAAWFGPLDPANAARTINRAIAPDRLVTLGAGNYVLSEPVLLYDNERFKCSGTLHVTADYPAIVVHGCYADLDVYKIEGPGKGKGTGVLLCENTYHCTLNVREMFNLNKGFDLTPTILTYKHPTDTRDYAGSQYCRFNWHHIHSVVYGIYIDPFLDSSVPLTMAWSNENYYFGGQLSGDYGIYTKARNGCKRTDVPNGNVFENIGFEHINKHCIVLDGFWFDKFKDLRISESLPKEGAYIVMNDCRFLDFDMKSAIPVNRIDPQSQCFGITMNGLFTDSGVDINNNFNTLIITCDITDPDSKPLKLSTTKWTARSEQGIYTCRKDETISFSDIYAMAHEDRKVFSNYARIWVDNGKTLSIDMRKAGLTGAKEADMMLHLVSTGHINLITNDKVIEITKPGFYKLKYFYANLVVVDLNEPTK